MSPRLGLDFSSIIQFDDSPFAIRVDTRRTLSPLLYFFFSFSIFQMFLKARVNDPSNY